MTRETELDAGRARAMCKERLQEHEEGYIEGATKLPEGI